MYRDWYILLEYGGEKKMPDAKFDFYFKNVYVSNIIEYIVLHVQF